MKNKFLISRSSSHIKFTQTILATVLANHEHQNDVRLTITYLQFPI